MLFLLVVIATLHVAVAQNPICYVCGEGKVISKPDVQIVFPTVEGTFTCETVETLGATGGLSEENCGLITAFVAECGCVPGSFPTPEPTAPFTFAPFQSPSLVEVTKSPTLPPKAPPTKSPTIKTTKKPTKKPVKAPTKKPVKAPSKKPVKVPTKKPIKAPTKKPVNVPTRKPA